MSPTVRTWSEPIGVAAYVTKGLIFALLGWFLLQAAITYDSQKAVGLDGALREVAQADWGKALLLAVAVGLLAYAVFCALEARYRKVGVSAGGTA
jgi:fatty-acid desaturase